jgi:hypothetical protein
LDYSKFLRRLSYDVLYAQVFCEVHRRYDGSQQHWSCSHGCIFSLDNKMFLKNFRKPRKYNSYWTFGPQNIYQIDTFSIFKLLRFADYEIPKGLRGKRGPYILVVIDLYSRYVDAEFLEKETFMDIAATLTRIFERMGKPLSVQVDSQFDKPGIRGFFENQGINVYVYKPYEVVKNQVVERVNRTIKSLILKYLNMYGWPGYDDIEEDVNHILRAICWYYNHRYHHGIRAIPWEVFNDLDDNRQDTYLHPRLPVITNRQCCVQKAYNGERFERRCI